MSDNQNFEKTATNSLLTAKADQSTSVAPTAYSQPIVIEGKSGRGLATGALALSVLALGASGFLFVEGQNVFKQQESNVKQELEKAALGESENGVKLNTSIEQQGLLNQKLQQLEVMQKEDHAELDNLNRGYNELLKGRVNWLVDEVEVTLNVASQQLLLSGNVPAAISVLKSINQRLDRFDQPELIPIKKAVKEDLDDLSAAASNYLDVSSTSVKIDSLEKRVAALPLLVDSTLQPKDIQAAPSANDVDFWTRTWDKTVAMLKGMVEIRKLESNDAMLLAPEQIYFIRQNLRLRLLDARLALLQHNSAIYKQNLEDVESTVNSYFDTQAPTTQAWLQDLKELNAQNLQFVSDNALSRSREKVRNYQNEVAKKPVVLQDVEARSDVVLPAISTASPSPEVQSTQSAPAASAVVAPKATPAETVPASAPAKVEKTEAKEQVASAPANSTAVVPAALPPLPKTANSAQLANLTASASDVAKAENTEAKKEDKPKAEEAKKTETASNKDKANATKTVKKEDKPKPKPKTEERNRQTSEKKGNTVGKQKTGKLVTAKKAEPAASTAKVEPVKPTTTKKSSTKRADAPKTLTQPKAKSTRIRSEQTRRAINPAAQNAGKKRASGEHIKPNYRTLFQETTPQ